MVIYLTYLNDLDNSSSDIVACCDLTYTPAWKRKQNFDNGKQEPERISPIKHLKVGQSLDENIRKFYTQVKYALVRA